MLFLKGSVYIAAAWPPRVNMKAWIEEAHRETTQRVTAHTVSCPMDSVEAPNSGQVGAKRDGGIYFRAANQLGRFAIYEFALQGGAFVKWMMRSLRGRSI